MKRITPRHSISVLQLVRMPGTSRSAASQELGDDRHRQDHEHEEPSRPRMLRHPRIHAHRQHVEPPSSCSRYRRTARDNPTQSAGQVIAPRRNRQGAGSAERRRLIELMQERLPNRSRERVIVRVRWEGKTRTIVANVKLVRGRGRTARPRPLRWSRRCAPGRGRRRRRPACREGTHRERHMGPGRTASSASSRSRRRRPNSPR